MPMDRFMIAPLNTGLQTNLKPFMIPEDAFQQLNNAYVWRGHVRKRFGSELIGDSQLTSRLRIAIGTTDAGGVFIGFAPGAVFQPGQMFSISGVFTELYTVSVSGAPAVMLASNPGTAGFYNTTNGSVGITSALPLTTVYFYPAQPVMGLSSFDSLTLDFQSVIGFDTQFAYQYLSTGWDRLGTAIWTGTDSQFFWTTNWRGINAYDTYLFVTNFNPPDQIKYWNGTIWTTINPIINAAGDTIETTRIILPFHDRLIFLNTVEKIAGTNRSFVNRVRFSQNGSPVQVDAWREDIPGKGGFLDAPTKEDIVTAQFLKDRLIVYFERSTWELVYTGNEILPFRWQQINSELGAASTFSVVPFDKVALGIGTVGVHACNGANVERIDQKIPQEIFTFFNNGLDRTYGIRDYFAEMTYWSFVRQGVTGLLNTVFPNTILVYNYINGSWSFNNDSITAFGYFQQWPPQTWGSSTTTWGESDEEWGSGQLQLNFRWIIAGNQEGFTFTIDTNKSRNASALQITDIIPNTGIVNLFIINHNLIEADTDLALGDYIEIEGVQGSANMMTLLNNKIFPVNQVIDKDNITIIVPGITAADTYTGGGLVSRISNIDIITKQYNFYMSNDRNVSVSKVDFNVDKTTSGQVTIDYYTSSNTLPMVEEGLATTAALGNNVLETSAYVTVPFEKDQKFVWHPVYFQAEGTFIQLRLYMSNDQLINPDIAFSDFQLNSMIFYAQPTSYRQQ